MPTTKLNIYQKLHAVQQACPVIPKNGRNPHFKSEYALLGDIIKTLKPLLAGHGLGVTTQMMGDELVTSVFDTEDPGVDIRSGVPIAKSLLENPQKLGGAITYYRRYNYVALFDLDTEVDDDGNSASPPPSNSKVRKSEAKSDVNLPW